MICLWKYICRESDKCYIRRCVYIHGNRAKKTCNGGHRTTKKGASTDPKKHFKVINFILGHFVSFLEEIYQEKYLDVSSALKGNSGQNFFSKKLHSSYRALKCEKNPFCFILITFSFRSYWRFKIISFPDIVT